MTTTANKGYTLPLVNADFGTWGTELNTDFGLIDSNLGANTSISCAGNSNVSASAAQAQNLALILTGALTGSINFILPAAGGFYVIDNRTTGAFTVTVITSAGGSTGPAVPQGYKMSVWSDGTNVYPMTGAASGGFSIAGGLTVTSGGMTVTSGGLTVTAGGAAITGNSTVAGLLNVSQAADNAILLLTSSGGSGRVWYNVSNTNGTYTIVDHTASDSVRLQISTGGRVTINGGDSASFSGAGLFNTTSTTYAQGGSTTLSLLCANSVFAANYVATSDGRLKTDVVEIDPADGAKFIMSMRPVIYRKSGQVGSGFIAQEVAAAGYEHLVSAVDDDAMQADGPMSPAGVRLGLRYTDTIAYLTAALRNALDRIAALEAGRR